MQHASAPRGPARRACRAGHRARELPTCMALRARPCSSSYFAKARKSGRLSSGGASSMAWRNRSRARSTFLPPYRWTNCREAVRRAHGASQGVEREGGGARPKDVQLSAAAAAALQPCVGQLPCGTLRCMQPLQSAGAGGQQGLGGRACVRYAVQMSLTCGYLNSAIPRSYTLHTAGGGGGGRR